MRRGLLADARCPACLGRLRERPGGRAVGDVLLDGELQCRLCDRVYPVADGAAYLAVMDHAWATILKELANRREIILDDIRRAQGAERTGRKVAQDTAVRLLTDVCFREALGRVPARRPLRLLDCGAGMFESSATFASMGIDVVATETEISMLRYANFEGALGGDPGEVELLGNVYTRRSRGRFPDYFSRVGADVQRLPFADGSFDVVFCRAMLHHVDRVGDAMGEMQRVLRPGGMLVACAEPFRSVLDSEADHHAGSLDREEGMNERAPTVAAYRRAVKPWCYRAVIQYWPGASGPRTRLLRRVTGYAYERHLWPGEEVETWKWVKLLPWAGALNLYATRNREEIEPPPPAPEEAEPIGPVLDVYTQWDGRGTLEGMVEGTERLKALRRRVLVREAGALPVAVAPGRTDSLVLESGWGEVVRLVGERGRRTGRRASVVLGRPRRRGSLRIRFAGGSGGASSVVLNGRPAGELAPDGGGWRWATFALADVPGRGVVQVELRAREGEHGVAVSRIEVGG